MLILIFLVHVLPAYTATTVTYKDLLGTHIEYKNSICTVLINLQKFFKLADSLYLALLYVQEVFPDMYS